MSRALKLVVAALAVCLLHVCSSSHAAYTHTGLTRKPRHNKYVGCYYNHKQVYRSPAGILTIDTNLPPLHMFCTHLIYAFAEVNPRTHEINMTDVFADTYQNSPWDRLTMITDSANGYKEFTNLRYHFPGLKVLLSLGGPDHETLRFSEMAKTHDRRRRFIRSVIEFLRTHNFEGLDVWWELYYPERVGNTDDKINMVALFRELRQAFREHNFILTATLTAQPDYMGDLYEVNKISTLVDHLHVKTFDQYQHPIRRSVEGVVVNPNSPLHEMNITIRTLTETLNVKPDKLVVGLPLFARGYVLETQLRAHSENPLGNRAVRNQNWAGLEVNNPGLFLYSEVCKFISRANIREDVDRWEERWDEMSSTPYAIRENRADHQETRVIVYDNEKSLRSKVLAAMRRHAGGVFVWAADFDDFRGECRPKYRTTNPEDPFDDPKFPLLKAITEALESSQGISNAASFSALTMALATVAALYVL